MSTKRRTNGTPRRGLRQAAWMVKGLRIVRGWHRCESSDHGRRWDDGGMASTVVECLGDNAAWETGPAVDDACKRTK